MNRSNLTERKFLIRWI